MNLHRLLEDRATRGKPIRVGLIGAGKFGSMFLAQALHIPGLHVLAVADLSVPRARDALRRVGWPAERYAAASAAEALKTGKTWVTGDGAAVIAADGVDVVVEATGQTEAGILHAMKCLSYGRHLVMVNVEADVLAGPLLARRFAAAGLVYGMAYGDQPALIAEMVDWARASGFAVVAAGKGTKYLPDYHASTPATVWQHYGLTAQQAEIAGMNAKMFNSFLDGTKSAIEMAAVANATGLAVPQAGLSFPPCGAAGLPNLLRPQADGGMLEEAGMVEVVSSLNRDGSPVAGDLRWGVYVVFEAPSDYVARCFSEYGVMTDETGRYAALHRPHHMIGLELGISIASAALRGQATGSAIGFRGDVVAHAKRNLAAGERLDGEGGSTVWGKLVPAAESLAFGRLPIGLAHDVTLMRSVAAGEPLCWSDVTMDPQRRAFRVRREMEAEFGAGLAHPES